MPYITVPTRTQTLSSMYADINQLQSNINAMLDASKAFTDLAVDEDVTFSGLTAMRLLAIDSSNKVVNTNLNQWINGTGNQITVTDNGNGTVTMSAPQDIHSGASPTFADLTLSSPSTIYGLDHDSFAGYVAAEHLNWTVNTGSVIDDNNIAASSITQHEGSITHNNLAGVTAKEHIDWTVDADPYNVHKLNITWDSITQHEAQINHDNLFGFVALEHIDWTNATQNIDTSGTINGTTLKYNEIDINNSNALSNVVYLDIDNTFLENMIITKDLTVIGDFIVIGDTYAAEVETVLISDNLGIINYGETGTGITAGFAGWEVDRGIYAAPYRWGFEESTDTWRLGESYYDIDVTTSTGTFVVGDIILTSTGERGKVFDITGSVLSTGVHVGVFSTGMYVYTSTGAAGTITSVSEVESLQAVATREDSPTLNGIPYWNNTLKQFNTSSSIVWDTSTTGAAKGDLLIRSSTGFTRLAVGSNGQTIIADSSETTGIKWAGHDSLDEYVANEHIDWTGASAGTIDPTNLGLHASRHEIGGADLIDHDNLTNTHDLTTDIDHDTITNNHNLTTDIDHDQLTNFVANKHIDWTGASNNLVTSGYIRISNNEIRFYDNGSNYVGFKAPALTGDQIWTLPDSDGTTGQVLATSSGLLYWSDIVATSVISDSDGNTLLGTGTGTNLSSPDATYNTFIGVNAGYDVTTGDYNCYIGYYAGENTGVDVQYQTFIGAYAGQNNTASYATAIGYQAGLACAGTGVAIGYLAGQSGLSYGVAIGQECATGGLGSRSVAIGYKSCFGNANGAQDCVFVGYTAGLNNAGGDGNTGVGASACKNAGAKTGNTAIGNHSQYDASGNYNTSFGAHSLYDCGGGYNVAVGYEAGHFVTNNYNILIGFQAGYRCQGSYNIGIGRKACGNDTGGTKDYNVAIGDISLTAITTAVDNTAIGTNSGSVLTTGSSNVLIGHDAGSTLTTESNLLYIENTNSATPLIYGEFDNDLLKINGILQIDQADADTNILTFESSDIAHALTSWMPTNTFTAFTKLSATGGGLQVSVATDGDETIQTALSTRVALRDVADTSTSTGSIGVIEFDSYQHDGADNLSAIADDGDIFCVRNNGDTKFIIKGDGDIYYDGADQGTYDTENDIALTGAINNPNSQEYGRLQELGIVDNGFISRKKLDALTVGSIGQLWNIIRHLSKKFDVSEDELFEMAKNYN